MFAFLGTLPNLLLSVITKSHLIDISYVTFCKNVDLQYDYFSPNSRQKKLLLTQFQDCHWKRKKSHVVNIPLTQGEKKNCFAVLCFPLFGSDFEYVADVVLHNLIIF